MSLGRQNFCHDESQRSKLQRRKRVAVIVPLDYRGGTMRGAVEIAKAIYIGSRDAKQATDVVFAYHSATDLPAETFEEMKEHILQRRIAWKNLSAQEARRAMRYAGFSEWEPSEVCYMVPDDGINQLLDCDLWLIVSDRLSRPLLPIRRTVLAVFDYIQRYRDILSREDERPFLAAARSSEKLLVTTNFTREDALQYAGIEPHKVVKLPMLAPMRSVSEPLLGADRSTKHFFVWPTNANPHKNHKNAAEALSIYYNDLGGQLACVVTGVNSKRIYSGDLPHLDEVSDIFRNSESLSQRVDWMGELPDKQYARLLSQAHFLWHASSIDNGTFSVIEAACLGVPSLSSNYPAMREIDAQFELNLSWVDPNSPSDMAAGLKAMELEADARRKLLPSRGRLQSQSTEHLSHHYWQAIREWL